MHVCLKLGRQLYRHLRRRASRTHDQRALTATTLAPSPSRGFCVRTSQRAVRDVPALLRKAAGRAVSGPSNAVAVESLVWLAALTTTSNNLIAR